MIEILGDDKIREHLNPVSQYGSMPDSADTHNQNDNNQYDEEQPCEDEEEMLEMMAMQEECRLEMMKFYVQSQNPKLFEEIYHDVSYPDRMKEIKAAAAAGQTKKPQDQAHSKVNVVEATAAAAIKPVTQQAHAPDEKSLKDLIISKMNPSALDFVPNKFSSEANKS